MLVQGGSNMTGTDFFLKTIIAKHLLAPVSAACLHKQSRSYLNHLVLPVRGITDYAVEIGSGAIKFRKDWFKAFKSY
jgi:hypothetical protein